MDVNISVEIYETDYVLFNRKLQKPVEDIDIIYSAEAVIDLFNNRFVLRQDEEFVRMVDLPESILRRYALRIASQREF